MGTYKDARNEDGVKKSPTEGTKDGGRESLGSRGRGVGRHSPPSPRVDDIPSSISVEKCMMGENCLEKLTVATCFSMPFKIGPYGDLKKKCTTIFNYYCCYIYIEWIIMAKKPIEIISPS